ncbi:MAG: lytic murein transglycosylase [Actinomycetes bacterium]
MTTTDETTHWLASHVDTESHIVHQRDHHAFRRAAQRCLAALIVTMACLPMVPRPAVAEASGSEVIGASTTIDPSVDRTVDPPAESPATTSTTMPDQSTDSTMPEEPPPIVDPRLSPELASVSIDSPSLLRTTEDYHSTWRHRLDAQNRQSAAETNLGVLASAQLRLRNEVTESQRRHDKSVTRLAFKRQAASSSAVASFVHGSRGHVDEIELDPLVAIRAETAATMIASVNEAHHHDIDAYLQIIDQTQALIDADNATLIEVGTRIADETARRGQARDEVAQSEIAVVQTRQSVADARMTAIVTGTDLSLVALDAYVRAAHTTQVFNSACQLRWSAIAGVGRVETLHGRYGGGPIDANGLANPPIVGIALDGTHNTAALPDTDGGAIDTDSVWDRAVGPMAFIPSSWRAYGKDGNGDGRRDVENIYDAALATAGLLCRSGPLDSDGALRSAYFGYNQSLAYVDQVLGFTHTYDKFEIPPLMPSR